MSGLRILMVNKFARVTGGADKHCLELARILVGRGHEVRFLSTASPANAPVDGVFVGCTVTAGSRDSLSHATRARVAGAAFWNEEAAGAAEALIRTFRPHVVHAHKLYPQLSVAPLAVARRHGVPIVQTLHDYELVGASALDHRAGRIDRDESAVAYRLLNTATFPVRRLVHARMVSAWVAVSRFVADVYRLHGIAAAVLPNFVNLPAEPTPAFEEREGVLFLGRLAAAKGIDDVLELARLLPDVPVTVAGDGAERAAVERRAAQLPNLLYRGFLDTREAAAELRRARVLVMPSRWQEPGPLSALEAFAAGTPVVTYSYGGLAEYVASARAGAVVDADPAALARSALALCGSARAWGDCSANGRRAAAVTHAPSRYAELLESIYADVGAAAA